MFQDDLYTILSAPTERAIKLVDVKAYAKVRHKREDEMIDKQIDAAILQFERTGRTFALTTFNGKFGNLTQTNMEPHPFIEIRKSPMSSLVSVKIMVGGSLVDVPATDYYLKRARNYSRLMFTEILNADDKVAYPLEVEFIAGYTVVPEDVVLTIKQYVAFLHENRGDTVADGRIGAPLEMKAILTKYKIIPTYG